MKKFLLGSSTLVAAIMAGPVMAADVARGPVYKAAPAAPALVMPAWTGPYIGAHCGAAWGRTRTTILNDSGGPFEWGVNGTTGFCGGQLGYNLQQGTYLFGLEGDFSIPWSKAGSGSRQFLPSETRESEVKYRWLATLAGRLGLTFNESLFYVKGGAAIANIKNSTFQIELVGPNAGLSLPEDVSETKKTKVGWTLGGGWEYAWTPTWSWKVEYLYMDFGSTTSITPDGDVFDHRNRLHTVKLGVNYRWGAEAVRARY